MFNMELPVFVLSHIEEKERVHYVLNSHYSNRHIGGHRGHDRMVVGFTTTYAISTYHH